MEKLFQTLKEERITKGSDIFKENETDLEKLMALGIVFRVKSVFVLNPLLKQSKTLSTARVKWRSLMDSFIDELDFIEKKQNLFRREMVEFFLLNGLEKSESDDDSYYMPVNTPKSFLNGKGAVYFINGIPLTLHLGYARPDNLPVFDLTSKFISVDGVVQVENTAK